MSRDSLPTGGIFKLNIPVHN